MQFFKNRAFAGNIIFSHIKTEILQDEETLQKITPD